MWETARAKLRDWYIVVTACSGVRLVYGGVRHARSEGGEGAA
jgi:hypothetical protein